MFKRHILHKIYKRKKIWRKANWRYNFQLKIASQNWYECVIILIFMQDVLHLMLLVNKTLQSIYSVITYFLYREENRTYIFLLFFFFINNNACEHISFYRSRKVSGPFNRSCTMHLSYDLPSSVCRSDHIDSSRR